MMPPRYSHEPEGYVCPLCMIVEGIDSTEGWTTQKEVVYQDELIVAWINPRWWPDNPGAVVICPTSHFENIFDFPPPLASSIQAVARLIAFAMKTCYGCDGISLRQHNEPAGNQEVWHYHVHVFPRYRSDRLYERHNEAQRASLEARIAYADRLRLVIEQTALRLDPSD